jgi:hypothetical protein
MHPTHTRRGVRRVSADRHCSRPARYPTPTDRPTFLRAYPARRVSATFTAITFDISRTMVKQATNDQGGMRYQAAAAEETGSPMNETLTRSFPFALRSGFSLVLGGSDRSHAVGTIRRASIENRMRTKCTGRTEMENGHVERRNGIVCTNRENSSFLVIPGS